MKHIKLFEQFEDDEDAWWEEESPFEKKYRIIKHKNSSGYYILIEINGDIIKIYDDQNSYYQLEYFDLFPEYDSNIIINVFENGGFFEYKYKNLPKEIKDKL